VGPPFNERNGRLVWEQALFQVTSMLRSWDMRPAPAGYAALASAGSQVIANSLLDFQRLALHVISSAAFGVRLSFSTEGSDDSGEDRFFRDGEPPAGYSRSWRGALEYMSKNLSFVAVSLALPAWAASGVRKSIVDIEGYINMLICRERQKGRSVGDGECGNLLSAMVHSEDKSDPLTDREIMGNVFTFSIAGHETVAATLQFALLMLALHPQAQEWFHRRLDEQLLGLPADPQDWDYKVYDRLSSCRCLFVTIPSFPSPLPR
jgi:cytochrome P450